MDNPHKGESGYEALGAGCIDQCAPRHLPGERNEAADRHDETDVGLRPFLRGQIDGNKWTEPGLYVSEAEDEPIEPAQTAGRWMRRPFRALHWRCCTRHCSALGPVTIEPAFGRARCYCLSDAGDIALVVGCASG